MATQARDARPLDAAELAAWRGLLRAHSSLVKTLDAELEQEHGLPLTSYEVLLFLSHAEEQRMRMRDLADSALLSRSGLTRMVDRLERDGFVERSTCERDARGAYAVLTQAGAAKLAAARKTHLAGVREYFLRHFSPEELATLGSYFERVLPGSDGGCPSSSC